MQATNRRWAYYYDFSLESYPKDAPRFDFEEVIVRVESLWKNDKAVHKYRNQEVTIRIKDLKINTDNFALLLHLSDIKASDPAFSNTKTGDVRVESKKADEGMGAACHILFQRSCLKGKKGWHLSLIEEVVGIPKSMIEQFLNFLFRASCQTTYKKIGSDSRGNICRPKASFAGHASSTLKESLTHSALQGITLLTHNEGEYIDDDKELLMTEQTVKLKVVGSPSGNKALDLIKSARRYAAKKSFDQVRVQYTEVVAEEEKKDSKGEVKKIQIKKQRTIPIEAKSKEGDLANLLFTKSELIELTKEIGQCENSMHAELTRKMKSLLDKI